LATQAGNIYNFVLSLYNAQQKVPDPKTLSPTLTPLPPSIGPYPTLDELVEGIKLPDSKERAVSAINVPAVDAKFRASSQRTWDPVTRSFTYAPAASIQSSTGSGLSWTPPVVTSRPRTLLNVQYGEGEQPDYNAATNTYTTAGSASSLNAEARRKLLLALSSGLAGKKITTPEYYRLMNQARAGAFGDPVDPSKVAAAADALVADRTTVAAAPATDTTKTATDTVTGGTSNDQPPP
jgi:hypothetical protein